MRYKQIIRVFLASSDELRADRIAFGDFIRRIDDIYNSHDVRVKLFKWEDYDAGYNGVPKQIEYNEQIPEADFFVGLFLHKAGAFTVEEVKVAQGIFQVPELARICIFFREPEGNKKVLPELKALETDLIKNAGYSGFRYHNCETLFLHFVMQLQLKEITNPVKILLKETQLFINTEKVVDLDKIPFIKNNEEWIRIRQELHDLKKEMIKLKDLLTVSPENVALNKILSEKQFRYQELKESQEEQEKVLYDTAFTIVKIQGHVRSERLQQAIEFFEKGDNRGANALLCLEDINREMMVDKAAFDKVKEFTGSLLEEKRIPVKSHIAEYRLKAQVILSDLSCPDRFAEACRNYEMAIELAESCLQGEEYIDILFDYAYFLYHHKQSQQAIFYFEKLLVVCGLGLHKNRDFYLGKILMIHTNLSGLYLRINKFDQAEPLCLRILEIVQSLSKELFQKFFSFLPIACHNLGIIYREQDSPKAENMFLKALEMREDMVKDFPDIYSLNLADTLRELSTLYLKTSRNGKAEEMILRSMEYYERYNFRNDSYAMLKSNLGNYYRQCKRFDEAEVLLNEALSLWEQLMTKEPEAYVLQLIKIQQMLGNLYVDIKQNNKAEAMYQKAFGIIEPLVRIEPEVYLRGLVDLYNNWGIFYRKIHCSDKSRESYNKALKYFEELAIQYPGYRSMVAMIESNLGNLYLEQGKVEEVEVHYLKALDIYRELKDRNQAVYLPELAKIHTKLGYFYFQISEDEKCVKSMGEALIVWHALAEKHPELYAQEEGKAFILLGEVSVRQKELDQANKYLFCGVKIFNVLAKQKPLEYLSFLGIGLRQLGTLFEQEYEDFIRARSYYFKASETYEYFFQLNSEVALEDMKQVYEDMAYICRKTHEEELALHYQECAQKGEIISEQFKKRF